MYRLSISIVITILFVCPLADNSGHEAFNQNPHGAIAAVLKDEIIPPPVVLFQLRRYLLDRIAPVPNPAGATQWSRESKRLRQHILDDVAFHGWPSEWVHSSSPFEERGIVETGAGYRLKKLRYEIVPGFMASAILYEPEKIQGKIPAILNVNGHDRIQGKASDQKQRRCINFARHGILALNLEWLGCGELSQEENQHWYMAHLDFVGSNGLGLFYLAMRRGLDYLDKLPQVDRNRIGVTGLSGGGWQTLMLGALDERVKALVPVAGFDSLRTRIELEGMDDIGDLEQEASDLFAGLDYTHLTAMVAPRPMLLIYNAKDQCCFQSSRAKPLIFDQIKAVYRLFGKEDLLVWHENTDPGTHNYELDNRLASYRFFARWLEVPNMVGETVTDPEIKSADDLKVGLPEDNLSIVTLARKMSKKNLARPALPADRAYSASRAQHERTLLRDVVRYSPSEVASAWISGSRKQDSFESASYLFEMNSGLNASGVLVRSVGVPETGPASIILSDQGRASAAAAVEARIKAAERVLALDLLFIGQEWPAQTQFEYAQVVDAIGERSLGLEVEQLQGIAHWLRKLASAGKIHLEAIGIRSQVIALTCAAIEPDLFDTIIVHQGMKSLDYVLDVPVTFQAAPELFCLDFYKYFDLDSLISLASPARVTTIDLITPAATADPSSPQKASRSQR